MRFIRIHDGEPLWLEEGVNNLHVSVSARDFPCAADERHSAILTRGGEEVAIFYQSEEDWTAWENQDEEITEAIWAEDFQRGDVLTVEVG